MKNEKLLKTLCNGLLYGMRFTYNEGEVVTLTADNIGSAFEEIEKEASIKPHLRKLDLTKPLEDRSVPIVELAKITFEKDYKVLSLTDLSCKVITKSHRLVFFGYHAQESGFYITADGRANFVKHQQQLFDYLKSKHFNIEGLEDYIEIKY